MTSRDLAAIRKRHVLDEFTTKDGGKEPHLDRLGRSVCQSCGQPWPCDAAQLLALLADTPSVEPAGDSDLGFTLRNVADSLALVSEPSEITRSAVRILRSLATRALDCSALDIERLTRAVKAVSKRFAASQGRVYASRRTADAIAAEYAALLPTQASDSPETGSQT